MSTRRARSHKALVSFEKKHHHQQGINLSRHSKFRWRNVAYAVHAELAYEQNRREKSKVYTQIEPAWATKDKQDKSLSVDTETLHRLFNENKEVMDYLRDK